MESSQVGLFFVGGLVPFSHSKLEFHTFIWHLCCLAAAGCMFALLHEAANPQNWPQPCRERWGLPFTDARNNTVWVMSNVHAAPWTGVFRAGVVEPGCQDGS